MFVKHFQVIRLSPTFSLTVFCVFVLSFGSLAWRLHERKPHRWAAAETPVAFWAWRNEAPSASDIERAASEARAHALFLRAGQIDYERGSLRRIRAVTGRFPGALELHLVYNGTRSLLADFERVDENALAAVILEAFAEDRERAERDGARIVGLQVDIDAPTRLLDRYTKTLRVLRKRLPQGLKLSITGLQTWMDAHELDGALDAVDFWIPQFYGALIPLRLDQSVPITSPSQVAQAARRARRMGRPFYAGLPSYGYALLYKSDGSLLSLRGDLDPTRIARHPAFELIESRMYETETTGPPNNRTSAASEWRYVYRARAESVIDGLAVRAGDLLLLDVPSVESLRTLARAVREEAGEKLLGICIFRLPEQDDSTVLKIEQVAAALADAPASLATDVKIESAGRSPSENPVGKTMLRLTARNTGTANARLDNSLTIDLSVPAGSARSISLDGFASVETLCEFPAGAFTGRAPVPLQACGERRANVLRLKAQGWPTGAKAQALIEFERAPALISLPLNISMQADDGRTLARTEQLTIGKER
jgi:hypothetical protein